MKKKIWGTIITVMMTVFVMGMTALAAGKPTGVTAEYKGDRLYINDNNASWSIAAHSAVWNNTITVFAPDNGCGVAHPVTPGKFDATMPAWDNCGDGNACEITYGQTLYEYDHDYDADRAMFANDGLLIIDAPNYCVVHTMMNHDTKTVWFYALVRHPGGGYIQYLGAETSVMDKDSYKEMVAYMNELASSTVITK